MGPGEAGLLGSDWPEMMQAHGQGSSSNLHGSGSNLHAQMNLPHPPPSHNVGTADEMVIEGQVPPHPTVPTYPLGSYLVGFLNSVLLAFLKRG